MKNLFRAITLSCLVAVIPAQMWAEMFTSPKKYDVWGRMEKMLTPATFAYLNDHRKVVIE